MSEDKNYYKAFAEVIEILAHVEEEIIEKISKNFISFLLENMDKEYIVEIDFSNENWEETILEETKAIIALIYRDYIISDEERKKLLAEEKKEQIKIETELKEKYNPDNLFKKEEKNEDIPKELKEKQLIDTQKYPWYKRLYNKIIAFFKGN